ncbi:MAG: precorrin-4 C(11)-methyltransferase [Proteobacteria bacterium]|nr:precorrin-4 C(11)-methyltransferase [Pseudomonadota bacterium]
MAGKGKVWFVGAGPGDPELITLRGEELLNHADVVIYAGSLVNKELLNYCPIECKVYDSSKMTLGEIIDIMEKAVSEGKQVVRLHTGDPSLYGAIFEQMKELDKRDIKYEVVPGVSSAFAGVASLCREFTVPGISQTVIFTRYSGRTKVPEKENLSELAKHRASMVIFLSIAYVEEVVKALLQGYDSDTPVAVIYRVSWDDEKIIRGNLSNIVDKIKKEGIKKTALIFVGDFLEPKDYQYSKLYSEDFEHEYRN